MRYKVELTIEGYILVTADSEEEAREIVENGYSLKDFTLEDDSIDSIYPYTTPKGR